MTEYNHTRQSALVSSLESKREAIEDQRIVLLRELISPDTSHVRRERAIQEHDALSARLAGIAEELKNQARS